MTTWTEGALALIIVVGLGIGLLLFTGEGLGGAEGDTGGGDSGEITVDQAAAARGEELSEGEGCRQCHTIDGTSGSGPTWKGLAGSTRPLANGEEVLADDSYLFNSIVAPDSQIVEGYEAVMPDYYADQLDEQQITDLVEYIESLAN